uniref:Endonuclease/exonuclease/phosphatase domain-containing protein n=1 Tax=Chromera velia CCMP2878 TaxID=1169474 RepID=A0A0G4FL32_9ALVE|eukprot:Cvel_3481.t1-p1 / transcript=Cvel_3481.t1 / gene=Cvel_3481 / organism=Chromera_velia_CCMP2878 / gene_product=2',5'-phosphodiesterase 12, putative / transcript_product=2',5'-phosphodiesterase 12, putative / location=Cvel_scaffold140:95706-100720(-) / protein_length=720 / sequence_SO=supercontig / SO=protein_coding / is_pseudo=false
MNSTPGGSGSSTAAADSHAVVRIVEEEPNLMVSLFWNGSRMNLNRLKDEPVSKLLPRIKINVEKALNKGKPKPKKQNPKKQKTENAPHTDGATQADTAPPAPEPPALEVCLLSLSGESVPDEWKCEEAFRKASSLQIGSKSLEIIVNPPTLLDFSVNCHALVDHPLAVHAQTEFATAEDFTFEWWEGEPPSVSGSATGNSSGSSSSGDGSSGAKSSSSPPSSSRLLHTGVVFSPPADSVGKEIFIKAFHPRLPEFGSSKVVGKVREGPLRGWREERMKKYVEMKARARGSLSSLEDQSDRMFSICSFNILAPVYARTPVAVQDMYPYATAADLDARYRRALLGREMQQIDADILCLQECSKAFYEEYLTALYPESSFYRLFCKKVSRSNEGCALVVRREAFELLEERTRLFRRDLFADPAFLPIVKEIRAKWPHFMGSVLPHMSTVIQLAALRHRKTGRLVVVGNSHFFFHPYARHIRTLQALLMAREVKRLAEAHTTRGDGGSGDEGGAAMILCGDLNSHPLTAPVHLLKQGQVPSTHSDWELGLRFRWSRETTEEGEEGGEASLEDVAVAEEEEAETGQEDPAKRAAEERELQAGEVGKEGAAHGEGASGTSGADWETAMGPEDLSEGPGVNVSIAPLELQCVYEAVGESLPFTNYVNGFNATLDWIFTDKRNTKVLGVLGVVEESQILPGLPSATYGSDHLSIAALLELKDKQSPIM